MICFEIRELFIDGNQNVAYKQAIINPVFRIVIVCGSLESVASYSLYSCAFNCATAYTYKAVSDFYALKPGAFTKGITADACHTVGNCYARKPGATRESPISDARHTVRDCYARKSGAIREGSLSDARHTVTYCHAR